MSNHPLTGLTFTGFQLFLWQEAFQFVVDTAPRFLPLRAIGLDVALTPQGSFILEGNRQWDTPNQHGCLPRLYDQLTGRR